MEQPMVIIDQEVFYSTTSLQRIFDVSERTIQNWRKDGKLPPRLTINGIPRFSSSDIKALVDQQNPSRLQKTDLQAEAQKIIAG